MTTLPVVPAPTQTGADVRSLNVAGLRRALATEFAGEVRFDKVSRALYSTDASVYQIEPLGVVLPRSRDDLDSARRRSARSSAVRSRCAAAARRRPARRSGRAWSSTPRSTCTAILELNVAERWARVEPGLVLDELNAQLRPHGLRFAPDVSTASRATIGGMMANNSSGARSVLYGKTIDHVLEQEVVLSDGSVVHFGPIDAAAAGAQARRDARSKASAIEWSAISRRDIATKSSGGFRECCGASAATTSTSS